jgi:pimeloyl-ACP methyl ester carboxylesterase
MDWIRLRRILVGDFTWKRLVRSLIEIYVALFVIAFFFADLLIFRPRDASYGDEIGIVKLPTEDGENISAVHLRHPAADYTVLYSHGNGEDIGDILPIVQFIYSKGFSVLAYDYRGYGMSDGRPSVKKSYLDAEAAYRYLVEDQKVAPEMIIAQGRSVGAALAIHTAYKHEIGGLIAESAFVTAYRTRTVIPLTPFDKFKNISKIDHVTCPILFIHGLKDRTIPAWHGIALHKKATSPKQCLWVEDAGHDNVLNIAWEQYWKTFDDFVESIRKEGHEEAEE